MSWDFDLQECRELAAKTPQNAAENYGREVAKSLLAIIDLQTRALLAVEWSLDGSRYRAEELWLCPCCAGEQPGHKGHPECSLDAALTAAGLPDQVSRDAKRREIEGVCRRCGCHRGECCPCGCHETDAREAKG